MLTFYMNLSYSTGQPVGIHTSLSANFLYRLVILHGAANRDPHLSVARTTVGCLPHAIRGLSPTPAAGQEVFKRRLASVTTWTLIGRMDMCHTERGGPLRPPGVTPVVLMFNSEEAHAATQRWH